MKSKDYFLDVLLIENIYNPEPEFHQPFSDFSYRFQSLYRNWILYKDFNKNHIDLLTQAENVENEGAEYYDIHSEVAQVDIEFFPIHLRGSIISLSLSSLENLLNELAEEIAKDLDKPIKLDKRPLPFINKYLLWFTRNCKIEITINKEQHKKLDAIREVRNRFIHNLSREIPENIKKTIRETTKRLSNHEIVVNDDFVDQSLKEIATLVKNIELSYLDFYSELKNNR